MAGGEPVEKTLRLWRPADTLSTRVGRLREEYFSFETRAFRNEVLPFTTGAAWDTVYACARWTNVPEIMPLLRAFEDSLRAAARPVPLPQGFWQEPLPVRAALFFSEVIRRHLPVDILDGERIVGGHFNVALSHCLNKGEAKRRKKMADRFLAGVMAASDLGIGNCGAVPGHLIPDYAKVLRTGFKGIAEEIDRALALRQDPEKRAVLKAMAIACEAARAFSQRYADAAERLAAGAEPSRAAELRAIARICGRVPWEPAESFEEALQSLWFTHMLVMVSESYPGPGVSFGRFDQYLYPFYARDIDSGRITRDQARELLECFWIKPNYAYDYQARIGRNQGINSSFGQLITLGGCGPQGEDVSNDLTDLCLDVIEEMNLLEPKPNIRIHARTPDALMRRICGILAKAQGAPFLLNFDEKSFQGLEWEGVPRDEVWNYACVGCLENTRQGNDRSGTVDVNLNLAKPVELALFQGRDLRTGKRIGPRTPNPRAMTRWEQFEAAYRAQLSHCLDWLIALNNEADAVRALFEPTPYLSCLVGGCIEKGLDVTAGGAMHNFITVEGVALATAADSLTAVKHLVFEKRRIAMPDLVAAITRDFEGDEFVRQMLLNKAPKYGNDRPEADKMARDVTRWWAEKAAACVTPATGKRYRAGYLSWNYGVAYAPVTSATPDGRKRGTFLANGVAAAPGMDRAGPTAAARSVGSLGLEVIPNGDSHTISLSPSLLRSEENLNKLAGFLRGYLKEGGTALQINMIDSETLKDAQQHPDQYRNLLVRVTGYNAYFVNLGREQQDEIIARTAHGR
jgi:formate C-acetyltransferase